MSVEIETVEKEDERGDEGEYVKGKRVDGLYRRVEEHGGKDVRVEAVAEKG